MTMVLVCSLPAVARDTIIIATYDSPYYEGKDGGLFGEIYKAAFNAVDADIELQYYPIKRSIEYLFTNKADAFSPGALFIQGEALKKIIFVNIAKVSSIYVYYKPFHDEITLPGILNERLDYIKAKGYVLGMLVNNPLLETYKASNIKIYETQTFPSQIKMLQSKKFDLAVSDYFAATMEIAKVFPDEMQNFVYIDVPAYDVSLAFSKGNPNAQALFDRFTKGFNAIKANGTYMLIMEKYWGKGNVPQKVLVDDMKKNGIEKVVMNKIPGFALSKGK